MFLNPAFEHVRMELRKIQPVLSRFGTADKGLVMRQSMFWSEKFWLKVISC